MTLSYRQKATFIYLLAATIASWFCIYIDDRSSIIAPLLFGFGLAISNRKYLKSAISYILLPSIFIIIFLFGTVPFYGIVRTLSKYILVSDMLGCSGAFVLVLLTTKLNIKDIKISLKEILVILILSVFSVAINGMLTNQSFNELHKEILIERFDLTVLVYQIFMSLIIISSMKNDDSIKLRPENINT